MLLTPPYSSSHVSGSPRESASCYQGNCRNVSQSELVIRHASRLCLHSLINVLMRRALYFVLQYCWKTPHTRLYAWRIFVNVARWRTRCWQICGGELCTHAMLLHHLWLKVIWQRDGNEWSSTIRVQDYAFLFTWPSIVSTQSSPHMHCKHFVLTLG